jgi:two-component sensor histidine kinase
MLDSKTSREENVEKVQAMGAPMGKLERVDAPDKQRENFLQGRHTECFGVFKNAHKRKMAKEAFAWSRIWLFVAVGFILLCIFSLLDEFLDLPHILLGAPQTSVNWTEIIIEIVSIAIVGFFSVFILIRAITERKRAEGQLKASLKEKEALISEIHHRVKSNLQVISSLLKLQSEYIHDEQVLDVLKQSRNRIKTIALIHEKLYQSKDVVRIDFADYVRSLSAYLFRLYEVSSDAIALKIEASEVSLGINAAIPCGLIVSELVSNSLKHAFPAGKEGEIHIEFNSDKDNQFTLIVGDNGVGLQKDLDFRKAKSLGLQLVNMLVDQLGSTIEVDRSDGTTFKITFTEPQEGKEIIR